VSGFFVRHPVQRRGTKDSNKNESCSTERTKSWNLGFITNLIFVKLKYSTEPKLRPNHKPKLNLSLNTDMSISVGDSLKTPCFSRPMCLGLRLVFLVFDKIATQFRSYMGKGVVILACTL
jgi:hypothetical protein